MVRSQGGAQPPQFTKTIDKNVYGQLSDTPTRRLTNLLWPPYVIGQAIIFCPVVSIFLSSSSFIFSSPNLSGRRLDVYHTSTHGVALVQI